MTDAVFAIPGDIDLPTAATPTTGACWRCCRPLGVDVAPSARCRASLSRRRRAADLPRRRGLLAAAAGRATVLLIDGLAYGAMPADADRVAAARRSSRSCIIRCAWRPGSRRARQDAAATRWRRRRWRWRGAVVVTSADDGAHARRRLRRAGRTRSRSPSPAPIRRRARRGTGAAAAAAGGRLDRAAQGLRRAGASAGAARRTATGG